MYCLQSILEDENSWIISGMPSQQAIMKGDEVSLSNPKGVKVEGGIFMTPTLSHQIGWFRQGSIVLSHVWEEKGVCRFTIGKEWENSLFPSFVVILRA